MYRPRSESVRTASQAGAALIMAMLAVGLVASASMVLLGRIDSWIGLTAQQRDKTQALQMARAGVDFARLVLAVDARRSSVDALDEDWARTLPPTRREGAEISGRIEDLQGRLNLNLLRRADGRIDEGAYQALRRLLVQLELPEGLADTLADWLDADDAPRAQGAEADRYRALGLAIPPANRPLEHEGSLLRIPGYSASVLERLIPHVVVLPGALALNLNTASAEVLAAVQPGLGLTEARALVHSRASAHFRDLSDYRERLPDSSLPAPLVPAGIASQFFEIRAEARSEDSVARATARIERLGDGSRSQLHWIRLQ